MFLSAAFIVAALVATPTKAATVEIRATVEKAIPYIEKRGVYWIEAKNCVSCHRVGTMVWSLRNARRKGFKVSAKLDEWIDWSNERLLALNKKGAIVGKGNREGVAQLIVARADGRAKKRAKSTERLLAVIKSGQRKDGSWKAGGQLPGQKRSGRETIDVTSLWLALAIAINAPDSEQITKAIKRAEAKSAQSTEWFVARLLLAVQLKDKKLATELIGKLQSQQGKDGGWGWIVGKESDALGTGMVLYALRKAGLKKDSPVIGKGQQFLMKTQRKNGSWAVKGTKKNKQKRVQETATYWGTTWAVIGLVETL